MIESIFLIESKSIRRIIMVKLTPPMGWNSWNTYGADISDELIRSVANRLIETGLKEAGYEYVVIDDCWSLKDRDCNGRLVPDPEKFPNGIKALADYIHSKGLKFGMYSCAGNLTCAGYPGSYEHEFIDAATFADWEVDFLKYDYCYHSKIVPGEILYRRMGLALENCGRDILFSACSWGADETHEWIKQSGASMWRSTGDIFDTWESIKDLTLKQEELLPYNSTGCFNDMDMLVVGMRGKGNVGLGGCSDIQYRTHFAIWAFMGAPLMIGCDISSLSDEMIEVLKQPDLITINQDAICRQPYRLDKIFRRETALVYAKNLTNGDIAIGAFNLEAEEIEVRFNLDMLGLPMSTGKTLEMREIWTKERMKAKNATFEWKLAPYDNAVFICRIIDICE